MPKQRFGLGRGLDALIPGAAPISDDSALDTSLSASALFEIPIESISPNPQQPRASVEGDPRLLDLSASIQQYGLLQPLLVTLVDDNPDDPRYQLIAGERRWRAAQMAGVDMVPVVIRQVTPELALELALVENLQRSDLNVLEEANAFLSLVEEYGLTHEQIAERVGRDRVTITNKLRLLQLPRVALEALVQTPKVFTEGHARAVLQINDASERVNATKLIITQVMSVRAAEELARRFNAAALSVQPDRRGGADPRAELRDAAAGAGVHPRDRDEGAAPALDQGQRFADGLLHERRPAPDALRPAGGDAISWYEPEWREQRLLRSWLARLPRPAR